MKKIRAIAILSLLIFNLTSCRNKNTEIVYNNLDGLFCDFSLVLNNNDYKTFNKNLVAQKNCISEQEFDELYDELAGYNRKEQKDYRLITYDNGDMILVEIKFYPQSEHKGYKIEKIITLPDEMKKYLEINN